MDATINEDWHQMSQICSTGIAVRTHVLAAAITTPIATSSTIAPASSVSTTVATSGDAGAVTVVAGHLVLQASRADSAWRGGSSDSSCDGLASLANRSIRMDFVETFKARLSAHRMWAETDAFTAAHDRSFIGPSSVDFR